MASTNLQMLQATANNIESDECYTPKEGVEPLLEFLDSGLVYYDCTSGISSNIVNNLSYNGYKCLESGGKDFLRDEIPDDVDVIITNPPYSKKDKFIARCYELGKPFALLLPVTALQGQTRGEMFIENGIEILTLNKRIDFTGKGSPHFGVAWFCHNLLPEKLLFR
ncbi:MAG: tRNA (adenine-N(6)-)-methyltransferase [Campylobacterota bacterium]|nr:tRNA (adenine-N(6)-)-methyltransferase [Campylobacterota bacterium]